MSPNALTQSFKTAVPLRGQPSSDKMPSIRPGVGAANGYMLQDELSILREAPVSPGTPERIDIRPIIQEDPFIKNLKCCAPKANHQTDSHTINLNNITPSSEGLLIKSIEDALQKLNKNEHSATLVKELQTFTKTTTFTDKELARKIATNNSALFHLANQIKTNENIRKILGIDQRLTYITLDSGKPIGQDKLVRLVNNFNLSFLNGNSELQKLTNVGESKLSVTPADELEGNSLISHLTLSYTDKSNQQISKEIKILVHSSSGKIKNQMIKDVILKRNNNSYLEEFNAKNANEVTKISELENKIAHLRINLEHNTDCQYSDPHTKQIIMKKLKKQINNLKKIKSPNDHDRNLLKNLELMHTNQGELNQLKETFETAKKLFINGRLDKDTQDFLDKKTSFPIDISTENKRLFILFDAADHETLINNESKSPDVFFNQLLETGTSTNNPFFFDFKTFKHFFESYSLEKLEDNWRSRVVPRIPTCSMSNAKKTSETSEAVNNQQKQTSPQARTNDTEYMLFTVLYKLREHLGKQDMTNIKMDCDIFSSFKMCKSCTVGMTSTILDPNSPINKLTVIDTTHKNWGDSHDRCTH